MNKNILRLITLFVVVCLVFSAFVGCKKTNDPSSSSKNDSNESFSESEITSEDDSADSSTDADLNWDDNDITSEVEPIIPSDDDAFDDTIDDTLSLAQDLYVDNTQIKNPSFKGINMIHSLYNYMPDKDNRVYNQRQIDLELDTMEKMRIKMVRSFYGSLFAWDPVKQEHNYESDYMTAFYKNCKDMEEIGVDVGITMQGSLESFVTTESPKESQLGPANIIHNGFVVKGDLEATAANYRKWVKESVLAFQAHGVNNIKHLFVYTECNSMFLLDDETLSFFERRQYDLVYPIFHTAIDALDAGLKDAGLREQYKIVGPCDASGVVDGSESDYSRLVKYIGDNLADKIDIIGSHHSGYAKSDSYANDSFYAIPEFTIPPSMNQVKEMGKEYWLDEYNVLMSNTWGPEKARSVMMTDPMKGIALGAAVNSIMNLDGVSNMFLWSLYDQQIPNSVAAGASSEFDNGIQITGYLPSYLESSMPRKPWYALSLLTRYVGTGVTYKCEVGFSVYISAIKRDDGEWTIVVTNYNYETTPINIHFTESMNGKNFFRYVYDVTTIEPVEGNEMIEADSIAKDVTSGFSDNLPAASVTVYTTETPANYKD